MLILAKVGMIMPATMTRDSDTTNLNIGLRETHLYSPWPLFVALQKIEIILYVSRHPRWPRQEQ